MSKQSLLLVDGDPRSLRVLEVSLKKAGFNVTTAINGTDALEKIALALPDLILSETKLDGVDGFELCQRLKANPAWSAIPFVFLTAQTEIEFKIKGLELGCDDYLTKPIYIKEIVTRVRILLQKQQRARIEQKREGRTRFSGRLSDMAVVDLIQTIELSRKSGVIQFHGELAEASGTQPALASIYFRDGKVIDAELGPLSGEDAVYRLLTWNDGEFEVAFRTVRRREVIEMTTQALLMEGMRRLDEWGRLLEQLPNLQARFEIDVKELSGRIGDIPDEYNSILKLFDGRRTLMEVIDGSAFGDLETLEVIAKLYFEGLLFEVSPPPRAKTPTEEWFPAKMLEATPTDPGQVTTTEPAATPPPAAGTPPPAAPTPPAPAATPPAPAAPPAAAAAPAEAVPEPVATEDETSGATAARLAEGSGAIRQVAPAMDEPAVGGPPTKMIFDENFQGEDATPLPGPMVEAIDDSSGPQSAVVESRGADTATAHGEVESGAHDIRQLTQRELLTIQPRRGSNPNIAIDGEDDAFTDISERVTGEFVPEKLSAAAATAPPPALRPAPAPRSERPTVPPPAAAPAAKPLPLAPATPRVAAVLTVDDNVPPPSSRNAYLIAGVAALAGVAILWIAMRDGDRQARSGNHDARVASVRPDAGPAVAAPDAGVAVAAPDAGPVAAAVDAAVAAAPDARPAATIDAGPRAPSVDGAVVPVDDKKAIARELVRKARRQLSEGNYEVALELIDEALANRKTPDAYVVQADVLRRLKRTGEAVESCDLAISLRPGYANAWKMKGNILWGAGRQEEARPVFERYLELEPDGDDADSIRARLEGR